MNRIIVSVISLLLLLSRCHPASTDVVASTSCQLTGSSDQLLGSSGSLTDELQRSFTYTDRKLQSIMEQSASKQALFTVEYGTSRIQRAVNGQDVIALTYENATASNPTSASFSQGGARQSTFVMTYDATGRMTSITETRQVLPANSLTVTRAYQFSYNQTGALTGERARFTLTDGTVVEQQTDYQVEAKPAPYASFQALPLLTLVALSQAVETRPGRFWQPQTVVSLKTYALTSTGNPANVLEEANFTNTYDSQGFLASQNQLSLLYQGYLPDPVTKQNQQRFTYTCF